MKVKKLSESAKLPTRSYNSNGYDLYASEDIFIPIGETKTIPTGIAIELEKDICDLTKLPMMKIEDRSSLASKGLRTGAGVVDFDYRGEIKIVMHNLNYTEHWQFTKDVYPNFTGYQVKKGDKIAQGIIVFSSIPDILEVDELSHTNRGDNGFGSTGT